MTMRHVRCFLSAVLIASVLLAAACSETRHGYNINTPGDEPLFVPVQEMKDSMLLVGPNSPDLQPAPEEIEAFLSERASSSGWNDYQILFSHLVTSLDNYDSYFALAKYEDDGIHRMEAGIVGIYLSGEKKGTIDYHVDPYRPGLTTLKYRERAVQMGMLQYTIKYTPGGYSMTRFGIISDPNVDALELRFVYGPDLGTVYEMGKSPLGQFTWRLDAEEYPCFLLVLTETHGPVRGEKPVRGFPHGHIKLTNWTALDEDGAEVDSWADPDYGE